VLRRGKCDWLEPGDERVRAGWALPDRLEQAESQGLDGATTSFLELLYALAIA
jgi:hypothetical protein